jgi:hypothetical protein
LHQPTAISAIKLKPINKLTMYIQKTLSFLQEEEEEKKEDTKVCCTSFRPEAAITAAQNQLKERDPELTEGEKEFIMSWENVFSVPSPSDKAMVRFLSRYEYLCRDTAPTIVSMQLLLASTILRTQHPQEYHKRISQQK